LTLFSNNYLDGNEDKKETSSLINTILDDKI
jgi:hypothetical protein